MGMFDKRSEDYRVLASMFLSEPDGKAVETFLTHAWSFDVDKPAVAGADAAGIDVAGADVSAAAEAGASAADEMLGRVDGSVEPSACDLLAEENRSEFARFFLGPKKLIAPPYESVYLSGNRRIFDSHTRAVREMYEEAGIKRDGTVKEPEDFLGFELEFAGYLLSVASNADARGDSEARDAALEFYADFLTGHLVRWIPAFCASILEASPLPLMGLCARRLSQLIASEVER